MRFEPGKLYRKIGRVLRQRIIFVQGGNVRDVFKVLFIFL